MKLSACFALVPGQPAPVQLVPGPVHTLNFASVFGSVISIGALRSAPLIVIFDVSAFANTSAGITSRRKVTKTESSRFTAHPHTSPKLDHPKLDRSILRTLRYRRTPHYGGLKPTFSAAC